MRTEELPRLHKHFNALYINQIQIYGIQIEKQRQQKIEEKIKKELDDANPKLASKSAALAAKYRAK